MPTLRPAWHRKLHDDLEAPGEGRIDLLTQVGGRNTLVQVTLDPRQQVADLQVRVAVPGFLRFAPPTEEAVRLIKEQDERLSAAASKNLVRPEKTLQEASSKTYICLSTSLRS
jgi:hypothetical protein